MIYSIYLLDNAAEKPLYVPGDDNACVYNAVLNEKLNDAGSLTFTVPPTNPNYSLIEERRKVFLYEGVDKIWRGFVVSYEKNSRNELKVTCIGELAYLNDTIQPQHKYQNMTPLQLFTAYVNEHNTQATEDFTVGMVTVTDPNDSVYRYTNYESTLTALREDLCESLEGYLRIRWENGTRYLDLVKLVDYGIANEQTIEFGSNLLDYAEGISAEDIATACLPLGAKLDNSVVDGLDAYLDIKSVNGGVDYIQNTSAVASYGLIKKVVHWDNVTVASNLKAKAQEWLTTAQYADISLNIKAVDMSSLNISYDKFNLGDRVRCFATPYGMDATYPIQEKTTYLQDPTKNYIELSNTRKKTYTQMQYEATADVKKEQSTVLADAQHRASELIKNVNEGNVYIKYGTDGKAEELCVMDTNSPDTATKVWRWNLNGFGYSSNGYDGTYTTAITMNGEIVADFVTTGTMLANRIRGGELKLGGLNNTNGVLELLDNANNVIGTWNKDGLNTSCSKTFDYSQYSQADLTKIDRIIRRQDTPTAQDYEKLDINMDGLINNNDDTWVRRMIDNQANVVTNWKVFITPSDSNNLIKVVRETSGGGVSSVDNAVVFNSTTQGVQARDYYLINYSGTVEEIKDFCTTFDNHGYWLVKRYENGITELYATIQYTPNSWTAWGNIYYGAEYTSLPAFPVTFYDVPTVEITAQAHQLLGWGMNVTKTNITTLYAMHPRTNGDVGTYNVSIKVTGRGDL